MKTDVIRFKLASSLACSLALFDHLTELRGFDRPESIGYHKIVGVYSLCQLRYDSSNHPAVAGDSFHSGYDAVPLADAVCDRGAVRGTGMVVDVGLKMRSAYLCEKVEIGGEEGADLCRHSTNRMNL